MTSGIAREMGSEIATEMGSEIASEWVSEWHESHDPVILITDYHQETCQDNNRWNI